MFRGLYTAGSALIINNNKIDVVSNNISNINTSGYKKDLVMQESFENILISKLKGTNPYLSPRGPSSLEFEVDDNIYQISITNGYMKVKTPKGISYHNKGIFTIGEDGYLKTFYRDYKGGIDSDYGYYVIGEKGPIYVGDGELSFTSKGEVLVDGEIVDNLIANVHPSVIGTFSSGVKTRKIETDFTQGQFIGTDNPLDFAIDGEGFFVISTPNGIRYTRNGSFKMNEYKELVTSEGYTVMGYNGPIVLDGEEIAVTSQGEVLVDGQYIDSLEIINITNIRDLRKIGEGLFKMEEGIEVEEAEFTGRILQGKLEESNVDPIKEMVEMMTLYRGYESNQRVIQAYDQTIDKAVNEIGRV